MNKSLTILAGASVLLIGLPLGMVSQARADSGTFADVPADHWAYQAVDTLQKAGIVIGYPDGTYGGRRAMTRYEFAEAIARLLPLLNVDTSNFATKDDLAAAKADLQSKLDANSAAIDALQQLVNGFAPELTALGQDVAAVKERLDALEARVAALEAEQARVHITGDVNIIGRASQISKGNFAVDENGSVFENDPSSDLYYDGYDNSYDYGYNVANSRIFTNDSVDEDVLIGMRGRLNDQATANLLIDFGTYLPTLENTVTPHYYAEGSYGPFDDEESYGAPGQTTIWEAYLATPTGYGPLGQGDLKAGRLPVQWTNYTLKSNDADLYTSLYQTTSGNIPLDGVSADLHTGPVAWNAWAGTFNSIGYAQPYGGATLGSYDYGDSVRKNVNTTYAENYNAQNLAFGLSGFDDAEPIHQGAGLRATLGGGTSRLGLSLEQFSFDTPLADPEAVSGEQYYYGDDFTKYYNRLTVYGADFTGAVPYFQKWGLGVNASYNEAAFANGSGFNNIESGWRNAETDDALSIKFGPVSLQGGYKYIGPDYSAPGYWGNIGSWSNPTNIEGGVFAAKIKLARTTGINLGYADYQGAYDTTKDGILYSEPLLKGDYLDQYTVGTGIPLGHRDTVSLGYEYDDYSIHDTQLGYSDGLYTYSFVGDEGNSGHPDQSFLTLGLDHQINQNATFKLTYQYYTYNDNNTKYEYNSLENTYDELGSAYSENSEGSTVVGQFSLKF